ncbi:MAG: caspase family protein [Acidobacteriota bacterium]|nr:caspase family protein [Acidobacteriota bacterium]
MKFKLFRSLAFGGACLAISFFLNPILRAQDSAPTRQLQQIEPVKAFPSEAKRWALVIGVDRYSDPQISPLKGSDNDARLMADALVRYAGFPQDQVILLSTEQPSERQPTRVNILRRLSNLSTAVPKDGLLLISFAGHGMERGGQAFLLPSDAQISDQISFLEETAISVNRVRDRIKETGVSQVVVFLDACRNDPGGRADAPNPLTQTYVNGFNFDVRNREVNAFVTVYATGVGQRAYEYTEKKQGYFTWAIVEGLKGGAANDKGEVTLANLIKYVQESVPKRVTIDLGSGKQQRPFSQMEGYKAEELVIAISKPGNANASNVPAITSVDPTAFELSYWQTINNSTNADDFKSYLEKYPDGQFAALAKNRINSLGGSGKPESKTSDSASEIAFWDSIKNSSNADDFGAYLKRYPDGVFSDLAANRIKSLSASTGTSANESAASATAGIGINIQLENNQVMIRAVTDGGPAARAGLKAGDQITRIGDQSVANISQTDIVGLIRGTPGTRVTVTYLPAGAADARTITLTREKFPEALLRSEQGARLLEQQKCIEAEVAYTSAVRLAPQEPSYHAGVGQAFACQNKLAEAESEFREAIRLGSRSPEIAQASFHGGLALFLWTRTPDRSAEAEGELRRAIALAPTEAYWHTALSSLLLNAKKMAEAEQEAREAIHSNAKLAWAHETLGIILWMKKDFSGGETELREAIRLQPNFARPYFDLSNLLREQKRWTEAEEAIRHALRLEPDNQKYQDELQNVLKRKH